MLEPVRDWFQRYFANPQIVSLALLLAVGAGVVLLFGHLLAPLIAALVIAFVLDGAVDWLRRLGMPRLLAVWVMFIVFIAGVALFVGGMVPLLISQTNEFMRELPKMVAQGQDALRTLPERYPHFISQTQVNGLMGELRHALAASGQHVLSLSLASVIGLITLIIYLILVPVLVFFFLKDKYLLLTWVAGLMPRQRALAIEVWQEVNIKFVGYVRGKILEILLVWAATYIAFAFFGLNYGLLLAVLVGLSVVIPYVGAAVVTVPVLFVAYIQWGFTSNFLYIVSAYVIVQFLDGNLLVPVLYSEMVSLHPVAIMTAVLLFGGLWGVWGVFFAIPLATLVQAVVHALRRATAPPEILP
ncbi:AI-2E family transporter [Acidihalobacter ferrooxydans]|uniref:AI-2E family transporter n=1 Tax=Acidihalobacter ferrooxydans TaxID=1765967 RepID=A0A1P8UJA5_9GAMM|nr:AI-2E family transporter [Acidihalobacter ferrooxydans]APZ43907.1 AI-2E family transporter [Acidihalobacter ferrooxydans]